MSIKQDYEARRDTQIIFARYGAVRELMTPLIKSLIDDTRAKARVAGHVEQCSCMLAIEITIWLLQSLEHTGRGDCKITNLDR